MGKLCSPANGAVIAVQVMAGHGSTTLNGLISLSSHFAYAQNFKGLKNPINRLLQRRFFDDGRV